MGGRAAVEEGDSPMLILSRIGIDIAGAPPGGLPRLMRGRRSQVFFGRLAAAWLLGNDAVQALDNGLLRCDGRLWGIGFEHNASELDIRPLTARSRGADALTFAAQNIDLL